MKRFWADPARKALRAAAISKGQRKPYVQAAKRARMKARWANPLFRAATSAKTRAAQQRPSYRARMGASMKKAWANPQNRAKWVARIRRSNGSPEVREKISVGNKRAAARPEVKARKSAAAKKSWRDPKSRLRRLAAAREVALRSDVRAKRSENMRKHWRENADYQATRVRAGLAAAYANPDRRESHREAVALAARNPNRRRKMSNIMARKWTQPDFVSKVRAGRADYARRLLGISASEATKKRKRGERGEGKDTPSKILRAAAARKLRLRGDEAGPLVYPESPRSSAVNYRRLCSENKTRLNEIQKTLSDEGARKILGL